MSNVSHHLFVMFDNGNSPLRLAFIQTETKLFFDAASISEAVIGVENGNIGKQSRPWGILQAPCISVKSRASFRQFRKYGCRYSNQCDIIVELHLNSKSSPVNLVCYIFCRILNTLLCKDIRHFMNASFLLSR